jgi:glycosyltransferase involved in cell wall biosynthesis
MKILWVIRSVDPRTGGPVEAIRQRAPLFERAGHEFEVATCDDPAEAFVASFPAQVHALGPSAGEFGKSDSFKNWIDANIGRFDAVLCSGIWQYPVLATSQAAKKSGTKYWVFTHGMLDPWFNKTYPVKMLKKYLYWPMLYQALRDAEAVLFTCEQEKLLARQSFKPYRVREIVVPYGTNPPPFQPDSQRAAFLERFPSLKGKRYILFLSRIAPKKGCDLLIQAFGTVTKDVRDLQLVMAGPFEKEYRDALEPIVKSSRLDGRVIWTGMLENEAKWGAFRGADAFALPSHQENFGISVVESMACQVPVLISNQVNIWREIEQAGAGLVEPDTLEGTTNLLKRWLQTPKEQQAKMGQAALVAYENYFTAEKSAASLLEIITSRNPNHSPRT